MEVAQGSGAVHFIAVFVNVCALRETVGLLAHNTSPCLTLAVCSLRVSVDEPARNLKNVTTILMKSNFGVLFTLVSNEQLAARESGYSITHNEPMYDIYSGELMGNCQQSSCSPEKQALSKRHNEPMYDIYSGELMGNCIQSSCSPEKLHL